MFNNLSEWKDWKTRSEYEIENGNNKLLKKKKFEMKFMQCCDSEVKLGLVADQKS